jgi:UDP-3-O-[3-hydroxymyristoyl] glucosamine N-acyltransferase
MYPLWRKELAMKLSMAAIEHEFQTNGIISEVLGDKNIIISRISSVENCQPGDLVFADKPSFIPTIISNRPAVVVASGKLKEQLQQISGLGVIIAKNVPLAHALLKKRFADRDYKTTGWSGIHPQAIIHPTAIVDPTATVEPGVVVGQNSKIGRNSRIMAGTIIENDVVIGDNTVIHPRVVIGYSCRIGNEVSVGSGTIIGCEGYGFAQDAQRKSYPIPQTGIVVLEDRVRLGANCCVDRATYHETRIGAGTKTDNLCHVAHNVQIGEDCLLTAMLCVAGSTKIGNRVIASGQTGIIDHMTICDDVTLVHRAGVSQNIDKPGVYAGYPLLALGEYMKNTAVLKTVSELRKRLLRLENALNITASDEPKNG